ncbi:MAG TPA: AMP-binding protein, partial [Bacteroidales bacterium]|nr:AMP-binding protein [Bacteroidales bacterium]
MTENYTKLTFPALFMETVRKFGKRDAFAFAGEKPLSYESVSIAITATIAHLEKIGVRPGDRVAVLGNNMPNWGISYYAVTFMGAVAVPILPDFSNTETANVLSHSEAKVIIITRNLLPKVEDYKSETLSAIILMDDFSIQYSSGDSSLTYDPVAVPSVSYDPQEEDLASIIYTSGTTGRSKGVMLTHKNICFNALKGKKIQPLDENDRFLSVLPLSHTYENTLGLILPMLCGSCVY